LPWRGGLKIKPAANLWRGALMRVGTVLASALLIVLVAGLFYKDYASLFRNNKELVKSLNPSNSIVALNSWYFHHKMDNLPLVKIGEDAQQKAVMKNGPRKNLTIIVLGETCAPQTSRWRLRSRHQPTVSER
jgi:lipid A ethanolaminephosphotransferase